MKETETCIETGLEIAVIGIAGRFPGAKDIAEFWSNLKNGVETISSLSEEELAEISPDLRNSPNFVNTKGGVLEDIEYFDAPFFNYTPLEAEHMLPQIRIFHECLWTALEDAGYDPEYYSGLIGLYAGLPLADDWEMLSKASPDGEQSIMAAYFLNNREYLSTIVSYKLNLHGPSFIVNTACSTSLVAVHLACQGLLSGDCDMALASGVSISYEGIKGHLYQEGGIQSSDGHCRTFDASADGTRGGNGAGVVVLKRLEDAVEDGDHIYAIIKGTAINNDGNRKVGFTAPSIEGQAYVIRKALKMAEINPETIRFIEAHGTATPLGDVTEVEALKIAFNTDKKHFCSLGSVKTNIGHLGAAAGIAGFIKTVLALKYQMIPPSLLFERPNPKIDFENSPFYVNTTLKDMKNEESLVRAGVSSFGIGGTNAHVILEEYQGAFLKNRPLDPQKTFYNLILLSAKTQSALDKITVNLAHFLKKNPDANLANIAYTLQLGRKHFPYRRKLVSTTIQDTIAKLSLSDSRNTPSHHLASDEKGKNVIFMFPGLGSQYINMGLGLYQTESLFRETMDHCFNILIHLGYDLKKIIYPDKFNSSDLSDIHRFDIAQLAIFIFEYALAKLIMSWGIKPHAMIGYSFGEYAAACISGVFNLEDILRLLVVRGKLILQLPPGMMLSVPLPVYEVKPFLKDQLAIAIDNGSSCVVSGLATVVKSFEKEMREKKLICMPLDAAHAIHSPLMNSILEKFTEETAKISLQLPQIPYISTITGNWIKVEDAVSPKYWSRQLRETVCFSQGIKNLREESDVVFLEVGPGRDISALLDREIKETADMEVVRQESPVIHLVRPSRKETPDAYYLLEKIGLLWLYGVNIDWKAYHSQEKRHRLPLPTYPFDKHRFWKLPEQQKTWGAVKQDLKQGRDRKLMELADCFYIPSWKQTVSPLALSNHIPRDKANNQYRLVFLDKEEEKHRGRFAENLVNRLMQKGYQVIAVTKGETFSHENDGENHHYTINPARKEDYEALIQDMCARGMEKFPVLIIHLWTLGNNNTAQSGKTYFQQQQKIGYYSLLYLAQALVKQQVARNLLNIDDNSLFLRIEIVSDHLHAVTGDDEICVEKAPITALCKTIPQEYPNITCRSLDIKVQAEGILEEARLIDMLMAEFTNPARDLTVAFRGNTRWIKCYEPFRLGPCGGDPVLLRHNGVYLVTGGLGNDSYIRSRYLAETFRARLILTGRTPLPDREYWSQYLMLNGDQDPVSIKIKRIQELESLGAEVLPLTADVSDELDMRMVMQEIEQHFGVLNGVIHAAGITDIDSTQLIMELDREKSEWHFQSKVYGLYVLDRIMAGRDLDFCLLTSSIATVIAGIGFSAYAAANIFMDAFAQRKNNNRSPFPWIGLNWLGSGPEETVEAFKRILSVHGVDQIIFSNLDLQELIRKRIELKSMDAKARQGMGRGGDNVVPVYERPALSTPYKAPRNAAEEKLADIWQRFFGIDKIGVKDDIFDLGGDSLKAINVLAIVQKELNCSIPLKEFFDNPTIEGTAKYITITEPADRVDIDSGGYISVELAEKKEYYVLSSAQWRMFLFQQMNPGSTAYNSPMVEILAGSLNIEKLEQVFKTLIERHETLRTSIINVAGEPVQKIHNHVEFELEVLTKVFSGVQGAVFSKKAPWPREAIIKDFIRPFDLATAPLMRVGLIKIAEDKHFLIEDMHHIITDAVSAHLFVREFNILYGGDSLAGLRLQYKDYSEWQNSEKQRRAVAEQEAYWLKQFEGDIPVVDLPTDFSRPPVKNFEGCRVHFELSSEEAQGLKTLGISVNATLFMTLLALLNILLAKISGREDIVIGTPSAGRGHVDLDKIIGIFINTLVLKNYPVGNKNVFEFLQEVRENALQAFANQNFPYEELVEKILLNRDTSRNPLFDIMFAMQNVENVEIEIPGLKLSPYEYEAKIAKFDLTLIAEEVEERLLLTFEYSTELFKPETIERFIIYYKNIVRSVIGNRNRRILDLEIFTEDEKNRILYEFNNTAVEFPKDKTIHQLYVEQALKIPDHVALIGHGLKTATRTGTDNNVGADSQMCPITLSYNELNKQSDRLAQVLVEKGVLPDRIVAIMIERSVEMIVGIIGILKSGGAYLPIAPDYPQERVDYMLKDSNAKILISKSEIRNPKSETDSNVEYPNDQNINFGMPYVLNFEQLDFEFDSCFDIRASNLAPSNLAYIIYTSGSTGRPKGVMVEHGSVVNLLFALQDEYPFTSSDTYLLKTSYIFDVSVTELFGWAMGGGRLAILEKNGEKDPQVISKWIEWHHVSHINFVPSLFNAFVNQLENSIKINKLSSLKYIFLAGEALLPAPVKKFRSLNKIIKLENIYGPTESTVYSSKYSLADWSGNNNIPIGRPLQNIKLYIFDKYNHFQPPGIVGELIIAGMGLARGYLNQPGLTTEKFIVPFYRTGDLARWLENGNIEFLGRIDQQVKLRGFRVEPGEIEKRLLNHPGIKEVVVLTCEDESEDKYLCAYIVSDKEYIASELYEFLAKVLPRYMIPSYFIQVEKIPLSANGKVNRQALPEPMLKRGKNYVAPMNETEKKLVALWSDILARDAVHASQLQISIGIDHNFFELGGHSMKAITMAAKIHKEFNVLVPLAVIFKFSTIRGLSNYIIESAGNIYYSLEPDEKKEYYRLSSAQKRLYILQQIDLNNINYNMPTAFLIHGKLDRQKFEKSIQVLIDRNETLRTSFEEVGDKMVQKIAEHINFRIEYDKIKGEDDVKNKANTFLKPFDLRKPPLLRVMLLELSEEKHFVLFDIHHIISDGSSMEILLGDFARLYQGRELNPLPIQYKDYAAWQNRALDYEKLRKKEIYWLKKLDGFLFTQLPINTFRSVNRVEGKQETVVLDSATACNIEKFCIKNNITKFVFLVTAFEIALSREIDQPDITIGIPVFIRNHFDLKNLIGIFLNVVLIRTIIDNEDTFRNHLSKNNENVIEALDNQDYPYEVLNDKMQENGHSKNNELFSILFNYFPHDTARAILAGDIEIDSYQIGDVFPKFDITLYVHDNPELIQMHLVYKANLYYDYSIRALLDNMLNIIRHVLENDQMKLSEIAPLVNIDYDDFDSKFENYY